MSKKKDIKNVEVEFYKELKPLDCGKCQAQCCRGPGRFLVVKKASRFYETTNSGGHLFLKADKDDNCFYLNLENNTCKIYDHRPEECRVYDCRLLLRLPDVMVRVTIAAICQL